MRLLQSLTELEREGVHAYAEVGTKRHSQTPSQFHICDT